MDPANLQKSYLTYILDVLVDLFHAFFAAFLSGGELEALRHLISFFIDLNFLSIKLDFTNLSKKQ